MRITFRKEKKYTAPLNEVVASEAIKWRQSIHKKVINPPFDKYSSSKIRHTLRNTFPDHMSSFLDVSCGDDEFIIDIIKSFQPNMVVCNDISTKNLGFLRNKIQKQRLPLPLFTNHNILELPYKKRFDVVLCKNTFHHLNNDAEIVTAIKKMVSLGKQIVLLDIENPLKSTIPARLWNYYYRVFLKDEGGHFITKQSLRRILKKADIKEYTLKSIKTVKGVYLLVVI